MVQGIVRDMRDLNFELNKRRTQALQHLNASANSGWLARKGAVGPKDKKIFEDFGSAPGAYLEYEGEKPERIQPVQISQGHEVMAKQAAEDIKEVSGINTDLLAMNETQASGRAIALRQKQGLIMVQKVFDNLSLTKRLLGEFLLSMLGEAYDVKSAARALGEGFVNETYGQEADVAQADIMEVLNETKELKKYDVNVGESAMSDTVRIGNYLTLMELAEKGLPIPPDVLIDESMLSTGQKEKIKQAIMAQQQAMQQQAAMQQGIMPQGAEAGIPPEMVNPNV
jgi:hypothetical protein